MRALADPFSVAHFSLSGLTKTGVLLLVLAAVAALVDWWSVSAPTSSPGRRARVELMAKPAVLALLIGVAATLHPLFPTTRGWFLGALAFCLAGDILLMLPGDKPVAFQGGLGAFLVGHALFLVGLAKANAATGSTLVALGVLVAVAGGPAFLVVRSILRKKDPALAVAVVVYVLALLTMAAAGWSAGLNGEPFGRNAWLCAGVSLFVLSDTLLAIDRFLRAIPRGKLAVHVTYHLAVIAIVISLAGVVPTAGPAL